MSVAVPYRPDVILAPASPLTQAEDLDRVNALLDGEGLGRPLGPAKTANDQVAVIPTTVDPAILRDALKRVRLRGEHVVQFQLDYQHVPGTLGTEARGGNFDHYVAAGCQTGHGMAAWLPAPDYEMPPKPGWEKPRDGRRPVIALLDEGVADHPWLPPSNADDSFVTSWEPTEPVDSTISGGYRGHGTFNAGIIRFTAPAARVLSMRVMRADGRVDESKLVEALLWLADRRAEGQPVDVVCIPFGRYRHDDDDALDLVRLGLSRLAGIPVVASAGNDGAEQPMYPAAFATEPELSVVSVGSSDSATRRAAYSNFGVWVKQWRGGTNALSVMPMPGNQPPAPADGFAWWTGTSFAAVRYAAEIARDAAVG